MSAANPEVIIDVCMADTHVSLFSQEMNKANGKHRILVDGEPVTAWARYRQTAYHKGFVSFTPYYGPICGIDSGVVSANAFCEATSVT